MLGLSLPLGLFLAVLATINAIFSSFLVAAQSTALSVHPGSIPLAVRAPYLSSWLSAVYKDNSNGDPTIPPEVGGVWPTLWNDHLVGWVGLVRVDTRTYQWLGVAGVNSTTTLAALITPTQTIFTFRAGPIDFNVTILNPVEPADWALQSFPFSYIAIDSVSRDNAEHSVQFYMDVTGEWVSGSLNATVHSTTTRTDSVVFHTMRRTANASMLEDGGIAQDGQVVLAAPGGRNAVLGTNAVATTQTGPSADIRARFDQMGRLTNEEDTSDRAVAASYPVISIAIDLGSVVSTTSPTPVVFALGLVRDPSIRYAYGFWGDTQGREYLRPPLWTAKWSTLEDALDAFLPDYSAALQRGRALDARIMDAARAAASTGSTATAATRYADLVGLSLRQTMASLEITGKNTSDVQAFMRNVGRGGENAGRASAVDTLYAALPAMLYLNASFAGALLDPLLKAQAANTGYPYTYAAPDLGSGYPNATLSSLAGNAEALSVDSCASMLIMSLAYAKKSGRGALLDRNYDLLKTWADYLVTNALHPARFATEDGPSTSADNANLALKGILGVYAMGRINKALEGGDRGPNVTEYYDSTARKYYASWESLAFGEGHVLSGYSQPSSWSLAYNLYAAKLIGADFIADKVYESQTAFYAIQLADRQAYGLGYDSTDQYTVKSHWIMFTAATVTNVTTRDAFISIIYNRSFLRGTTPPFATTWDSRSGATLDGIASPAQGAMLALMALNVADLPIVVEQNLSGSDVGAKPKGSKVGAIVGGVIGGVALVIALLVIFLILHRRHNRRSQAAGTTLSTSVNTTGREMSTADHRSLSAQPSGSASVTDAGLKENEGDTNGDKDNGGISDPSGTASMGISSLLARLFSRRGVQGRVRPLTPFTAAGSSSQAENPAELPRNPFRAGIEKPSLLSLSNAGVPLAPAASASPMQSSGLATSSPQMASAQTPNSPDPSLSHVPQTAASTGGSRSLNPSPSIRKVAPPPSEDRDSSRAEGEQEGTALAQPAFAPPPLAPPMQGTGGPASSPDADDLRAEVVELRRQMEEMRARERTMQVLDDEPPPSYTYSS